MGRYYYGDINAKFWFSYQSSDDASNFGIMPSFIYCYYSCGCEGVNNTTFCNDCFQTFDEHHKQYLEDYDNDIQISNLINDDFSALRYEFTQNDLQKVQMVLKYIESKYQSEIRDLELEIDSDAAYEYTINGKINVDDDDYETKSFLARYCLGRQIEKCLIETGRCNFDCEL